MEFIVKENENHQLESIVNKNDKYKMIGLPQVKNGEKCFFQMELQVE